MTQPANRRLVTETALAALVGIVLARAPGFAANTVKTATSGTFSDVDATNLAVTFTVPDGVTAVEVTFEGVCQIANNSLTATGPGSVTGLLNLREGTTDLAGTSRHALTAGLLDPGEFVSFRVRTVWRLTGLTPGSTRTLKLGFAASGVAASGVVTPNFIIRGGATAAAGPVELAVRTS